MDKSELSPVVLLVRDKLSSDPAPPQVPKLPDVAAAAATAAAAAADPFFFFVATLKLVPGLGSFLAFDSPHMLVPPWVEGMFKKVIPCNGGPSLRFKGTPSH